MSNHQIVTVTFTKEEFDAIQHVVDFYNRTGMETMDGEYDAAQWIRNVIVDRLGMMKFEVVTSNRTTMLPQVMTP